MKNYNVQITLKFVNEKDIRQTVFTTKHFESFEEANKFVEEKKEEYLNDKRKVNVCLSLCVDTLIAKMVEIRFSNKQNKYVVAETIREVDEPKTSDKNEEVEEIEETLVETAERIAENGTVEEKERLVEYLCEGISWHSYQGNTEELATFQKAYMTYLKKM